MKIRELITTLKGIESYAGDVDVLFRCWSTDEPICDAEIESIADIALDKNLESINITLHAG